MRDLYHNILVTQILNPVSATTTKTSSTVDLQGYNSACVTFHIGQSGDTLSNVLGWTLSLQQSNDGVTFTPVAASDISSGVASVTLSSPSTDRQAYNFGYIGNMRYLQGVATPVGSPSSGVIIGMSALRGTSAYKPVVLP